MINKGDKIGHTLDDKLVNNILNTEKGARPDPSTYMSQAEIDVHLAKFDDGAVRITSKNNVNKYGTYGSSEAFVMPASEFDRIMIESKGDLKIVEQRLGLKKGELSNSDTIAIYIKKENFNGLKLPSGNESGANQYWKPGGVTSGGVSEATLNLSQKTKVEIIDLSKYTK